MDIFLDTTRYSKKRYILYVIIILVAGALLYLRIARDLSNFLVPSTSMEPALRPSDYIFTVNEDSYQRGDIVVLRDPTPDGTFIVKRIVGLGGDSIEIKWGALYINGRYASEPYIEEPMNYDFLVEEDDRGNKRVVPFTVPDGHVFVLGDNRNDSEDSSLWNDPSRGLQYSVPASYIIGKVRGVYLPFKRTQWITSYPLSETMGGEVSKFVEQPPDTE